MPYIWTDMVLYFFLYSFIGWGMETVLCSVRERRFINRGFLNGPLCPIYGCGVMLILLFLLPVRDGISHVLFAIPVVFAAGAVLASMVEYATSWCMEKLFHARWWDYSSHRFHLKGRICLEISLAWGGLSVLLIYILQPLLEKLVGLLTRWNSHLPAVTACLLLTAFVVDSVVSVRIARALGNKLEQIEKLGELVKAHIEGLEKLSAADFELRLEAAYDRFAGTLSEFRIKAQELRGLSREERTALLHKKAEALSAKRAGLMEHMKKSHWRLLRAFPTMRRRGDSRLMAELREFRRRKK